MTTSKGYNVGDDIFAFNYRHGEYHLMEGTVERITPKGRIAAVFKGGVRMAFMPSGREVGGGTWYHWVIYDKDQQDESARLYREEQEARRQRQEWRADVEILRQIPFDSSSKADLLKQLEVLKVIVTKLE